MCDWLTNCKLSRVIVWTLKSFSGYYVLTIVDSDCIYRKLAIQGVAVAGEKCKSCNFAFCTNSPTRATATTPSSNHLAICHCFLQFLHKYYFSLYISQAVSVNNALLYSRITVNSSRTVRQLTHLYLASFCFITF